jgi:hypothetical protein
LGDDPARVQTVTFVGRPLLIFLATGQDLHARIIAD